MKKRLILISLMFVLFIAALIAYTQFVKPFVEYDDGEGTVSTIVCNWFGAGNAGLADPNSDSSIQSYANIYDQNWLMKGNVMIAPDVERVDTMKTDNGYEIRYVCRQQRQCALLPNGLSGAAALAGSLCVSAGDAVS